MDPQTHTWRDVKQEPRYSSSEDKDELPVVVFSNSFYSYCRTGTSPETHDLKLALPFMILF